MNSDVMQRIRTYIDDNFLYMRPDAVLGDHDSLLGTGIIDSMGVMELIVFVESEFGLSVADAEVTKDNFDSVATIARFVESKSAGVEAA
jgi:acyl carrier protein